MTVLELDSRHVLILGLGDTGMALARWCQFKGARVSAWDSRTSAPGETVFAATFGADARRFDITSADALDGVDVLALSPGLAPDMEPVATLLTGAKARNIPVVGEFELFAHELAARGEHGYQPSVLAITGTNGKTTVTSLAGKLCREARRSVRVAGNIRPAVLDALLDAVKRDALPEIWVLELSSFQLESTSSFAPDAAVILNLTQDHLDWHGSMQAYLGAKLRIFSHSRQRIVNRDDNVVVAGEQGLPRLSSTDTSSFGLDAPRRAGDFGVIEEGGMRWLATLEVLEQEQPSSRRQKVLVEVATRMVRLMPAEALRIHGDHNIANALAALALCRAIDLPMAPLLRALAQYRGEAHRVELIAELDGVTYIDDSKGTNVGATVAALKGLGQPVVLIAGGVGKDQDFSPLAGPVARHARAVILIGQDRDQIRGAIEAAAEEAGVILAEADSIEDAVHQAGRLAQQGDAVLLSPACASLDMFRDYVHRARAFGEAVRDMMMEAGQPC